MRSARDLESPARAGALGHESVERSWDVEIQVPQYKPLR